MLESGDDTPSDPANELNEVDDPPGRYTRGRNGRHRGLGGTSSRWGGRMVPVSLHDVAARPHVAQPAWAVDMSRFDSYEPEIERLFRIAGGSYEQLPPASGGGSRTFPVSDTTLVPRWAKVPRFKNCNIATLLQEELRSSPDIGIWLGATVCGFDLDRETGRLRGLVARSLSGNELHVRADHFILAAGSIETTRLLLLLDAQSDDRAFADCQVLGRYFQDHLKAEIATICRRDAAATNRLFAYRFVDGTRRDLHLELSQDAQKRDRVGSAFAYVAMDLGDGPLSRVKALAQGLQRREVDLKAMAGVARNVGLMTRSAWWRYAGQQLFVPPEVELKLMVCVEQLPQWSNRIRLSHARDRLGCPRTFLEWTPMPSDEMTFRSMIENIAAYWAQAGFNKVCPLAFTPGASTIIARAEACAHPSGSTRMGTDPTQSVVGPDLHCHAIPNLAAVSASVFPTAGSANPTLTIMKLALWVADEYLRLARSGPALRAAA